MSAYGLEERENTLARLADLCGGRVWEGSVPDDVELPRAADGKVLPCIVVNFGASVRSTRDRNLAKGEKGQPHSLPVNIACIAGDIGAANRAAAEVSDRLLDWAPSATSDAFTAKGGYGTRRPSTESSPTRQIVGGFFEAVINNG